MSTDPLVGSLVWVSSSLAFLAAGTAIVRALEVRTGRPAEEHAEQQLPGSFAH